MDFETDRKLAFNNILLELFEVIIHNILFIRKLYPDGIFKLMKKYNIPIHVSQYPDLNSYITECLKTVDELLKTKKLKQISVCFYNKEFQLLETVVLRFFMFNHIEKNNANELYPLINEISQSMRDLLLKLSSSASYLKPLPEGSTFRIHIHTTEQAMINLSTTDQFQSFPWIEAEESDNSNSEYKIVPVRNLNHFPIKLEVFFKETIRK